MKNLQKIREEKGLRREVLATRVGSCYASIRAYEKGIADPSFSMGMKIAKELGVKAEKLIE